MFIVSQDRTGMVNVERLDFIEAEEKDIICYMGQLEIKLGSYETEETAKKVMTGIKEFIERRIDNGEITYTMPVE